MTSEPLSELPPYSCDVMDLIQSKLDVLDDISDAWEENNAVMFQNWANKIHSTNEKYGVQPVVGNTPFEVVMNYVQNKKNSFKNSKIAYEKYVDSYKDDIIRGVRSTIETSKDDEYIFSKLKIWFMNTYSDFGWIRECVDPCDDVWMEYNCIWGTGL